MKLNFTKMQGCGNDFIFIDCLTADAPNISPQQIQALCDRHFGIGADGLVMILPSSTGNADARMRMYNPDGSDGGMCGNAIRCIAKYLLESGTTDKTTMDIETNSGVCAITAGLENGRVVSAKVDMGLPRLMPSDIPVLLQGDEVEVVGHSVHVGGKEYSITCVSMGNPHAVVFCEAIDDLPLAEIGPLFEHNALFPERVNTEFVQILGRNHLKMRVWERGAGETLACGTGASAAAVAAVLNNHCDMGADIKIELLGGELIINYTEGRTVYMTGGCEKVFEGAIEI